MSDLYGAPSGYIAASNEDHVQAMTRLGQANAAAVEYSTARDQQMMALLAAPGTESSQPSTPESLITRMEGNANKLLGAGFAVQGDKMAQTASTMRWNLAKIKHDQNLDARMKMQEQLQAAEQIDSLLSTVYDQPSLDKAVAAHDATAEPDNKIPDQFKTYDPTLFNQLRHGTKGGIASLRAQLEDNKQESLAQTRQDNIERKQAWLDLNREKFDFAQQVAERRAKTGGPKSVQIKQPTAQQLTTAQAMIRQMYPGIESDMPLGKERISLGANAVASRANALMAANQGLQSNEAMTQALIAEKDNFQTTPEEEGPGAFGVYPFKKPAKTNYIVGGKGSVTGGPKPGAPGSQVNPLPAPADGKSFQEGMWYNSPKLGVGQLRGGRFIPLED